MPRVGFEPTTPVFEREKAVHTLDRTASVIGGEGLYCTIIYLFKTPYVVMETTLITDSINPRHYFIS
jgi:hypothetical protein